MVAEPEKLVQKALDNLAVAAHAKAAELAHERLHGRLPAYLRALHLRRAEDGMEVVLEPSAGWIEDGLPKRDMRELLLSSPKAKTAKDGTKYLAVPMRPQTSSLSEARAASPAFVTVTSRSAGWEHPGLSPAHILRHAGEWGRHEFEERIWPELLRELLDDV